MMLASIGAGFKLDSTSAVSWLRTKGAGNPAHITTAYRDRAYQQRLYDGWLARKPGYNFALPPGQSKHELGLAVDVDRATANWLSAHGAAYGWRGIKSEWWHFEYTAAKDTHRHNATEDDMTPDESRKLNAIYDALFKKDVILPATTGGNTIPGGLLRMASIQYDAIFQQEGVNGATRDGILASLASRPVGIATTAATVEPIDYAKLADAIVAKMPTQSDNADSIATKAADKVIAWFKR